MPRKTDDERTSPGTNRLSIPLSPEGGIDWAGMRGSTKQRLLTLAGDDPTILESIGMAGWVKAPEGAGEDGFPGVTEANVAEALDIVSKANALLFRVGCARFVKHPLKRTPQGGPVPFVLDPDVLMQAFTLTKEQHAELDPRATRLAQKNTPEWLKKNLDLYMLIGMYLKYTADNAQTAMKLQLQRDYTESLKRQANAAATAQPVDTDARTVHTVSSEPAPSNGRAQHVPGNAQPGAGFAPDAESFEPGSDSAIAP